jgi:hypothetical protein
MTTPAIISTLSPVVEPRWSIYSGRNGKTIEKPMAVKNWAINTTPNKTFQYGSPRMVDCFIHLVQIV